MKKGKRLIVLLLTLAMVMSQMSLVAFAGNEAAGESEQTVTEQAAVETAFDQTVTENGVDITVKAAEGVFPAGAKLSVKKVDVPDAIDSENALAFDIKILVDGEEVQPKDGAKVEVSFKTAEVRKYDTEVYHMDGSEPEQLDVEEKGSTATVETTGFSTYVLIFKKADNTLYTMAKGQKVSVKELYEKTEPEDSIGFDNILSTDPSKIMTDNNYVWVPDGAKLVNGETVTLTVNYRKTGNSELYGHYEITVEITDVDASGEVISPQANTDLVYNGKAQALVKPGSTEAGTMQYKLDNGAWAEWNDANPISATDVGTYTVYWKVVGSNGDVFHQGEPINVEIKDVVLEAPTAKEGLVENGTAQGLLSAGATTNGGTVYYNSNLDSKTAPASGWTIADYLDVKATEAGEYYVWYAAFNDSGKKITEAKRVTVTIDSGVTELKAKVVAADMVYGDAGTEVHVESADGTVLDDERWSITYYYKKSNTEKWLAWGPDSKTAAGTYDVKAQVIDTEGEYEVTFDQPDTFAVNQKDVTFQAIDKWITYGDSVDVPSDFDCDITGLVGEDAQEPDAVVKVTYTFKDSSGNTPKGDISTWPAGKYTIIPAASFLNGRGSNYTDKYVNGTLNIEEASDNYITVKVDDYFYGDTIIKPEASADYGTPEISWMPYSSYTGSNPERDWRSWSNNSIPKDAGRYIVRAKVTPAQGETYSEAEVKDTFYIYKKAATITIPDGGREYSSTTTTTPNDAARGYKVTGLVNGETLRVRQGSYSTNYDIEFVSSPSPIREAGEYNISANVNENGNVAKNYEITIEDGTYTVTDGELDVDAEYDEGTPEGVAPFDGERHGIDLTVRNARGRDVTDESVIYYSVKGKKINGDVVEGEKLTDENYDTAGTINSDEVFPVDAGTYTIYYYVTYPNYEAVAGSMVVTIKQSYLRITVLDQTTEYGTFLEYNDVEDIEDAEQRGFITVKAYSSSLESESTELPFVKEALYGWNNFEFDTDKYTDEKAERNEVGTYAIKVKNGVLDSDNYIIRYTRGSLEVTQKPLTFDWSTPNVWKYDGKEHEVYAELFKDQLVGDDKKDGEVTVEYVTNKPDQYTTKAVDVRRNPETWAVESYTAKVKSLGGDRGKNYYVLPQGEAAPNNDETLIGNPEYAFQITPVGLTLTPDLLTIPYGDDPYDYDQTFTPSGLVNGEKIDDVLLGTPVEYEYMNQGGMQPYKPGDSDAGKYGIEITNIVNTTEEPVHNTTEGLHAQNYQVAAELGRDKLDVVPREITIIWQDPDDLEYNGEYKEVSVVRADKDCTTGTDPEKNSALYGATLSENKKVNAGPYTAVITLSERAQGNFKILDNSDKHDWEITKRPATVYANSNAIYYGQAPADKGYFVDNKELVTNVETGPDSIGDVSFNINYRKNGRPGVYSITPVVNNLNPNYYIAGYKAGKLIVKDKVTELVAQGKTRGKKAGTLSWNVVTGAASYDIYWSKCNTKKKVYTPKLKATVSGNTYTVKKLKKGTAYKFYIVAKDSSGKPIAKSEMGHFIIGNVMGKYTNPKKITTSVKSVTLVTGSSTQVSTTITKVKKKKKLLNGAHTQKLRYISANPAVASVAQNGIITAAAPGWCRVYAIATDGMWSVIEVNVK